jgi:hypothetical protein
LVFPPATAILTLPHILSPSHMASSKPSTNGRTKPAAPPPVESRLPIKYLLPPREWVRATDLITMFVATGWLASDRPQSLLLVGEPASGKTELLNRFTGNSTLYFASDMTVSGLHRTLKQARDGAVTHIIATEFQKYFMRRSDAVQNFLGTLSQAMDEGVGTIDVGSERRNMRGAKLGLIAAITPDAYKEHERFLKRLGFLSRITAMPWKMTRDEVYNVMTMIGRGDMSDLAGVVLPIPERPIYVELDTNISIEFQRYVWDRYRSDSVLRIFKRFRALAMACAVLDGRDVVHARDVEKVVAFEPYWAQMYRAE